MAVKSIIDIEVNDAAFKSFVALFDKYKKDLSSLPKLWDKTGQQIENTADRSQDLLSAIETQTNLLNKQLITQIKIHDVLKESDRSMVKMNKTTLSFYKNIKDVQDVMVRLKSAAGFLGGVFSFLSGGTGFFGLDALARGASQTRQQAGELGINPNELQAAQTAYRRLPGASSALSGIASAQTSATRRAYMSAFLGIDATDIQNKSAAELMPQTMMALQSQAQGILSTNPEQFETFATSRHLTDFMSVQQLRQLARMQPEELQGLNQQFSKNVNSFDLTDKTVSAWDTFLDKLSVGSVKLQDTLITKLTALAGPIGNVVEAFTNLANSGMSNPAFKDGLNKFAKWINEFAVTLGKPETAKAMGDFADKIVEIVKVIANAIDSLANLFGPSKTTYNEAENAGANERIMQRAAGVYSNQGWFGSVGKPLFESGRGDIYKTTSSDFVDIERQYGLPRGFLNQIKNQEWDPNEPVSKPGAVGPFQFMPGTAKDYGLKDPFDLRESADAAGRYFSDLLKMFNGDIEKAAAGYNWGQGNVKKDIAEHGEAWKDYLPPETKKYIADLNRAGFVAQPGQGVKISISNATGGNTNVTVSALAGVNQSP